MKNLKLILLISIAAMVCAISFAQQDTSLTVGNVTEQVGKVIQTASGHDLTWKIMLFSAIAGALIRIIYTTIKGVKNPVNDTPIKFIFAYWVKDNALPKIATVLTFVVSFNILSKLPEGIVAYIVFGAIGLIIGLFVDLIYDLLKGISPKIS
jgi:hypothetical protein